MTVIDVEAVSSFASTLPGVVTMMDATFATPYLMQPIKLGFDISIHSWSAHYSRLDIECMCYNMHFNSLQGDYAYTYMLSRTAICLSAHTHTHTHTHTHNHQHIVQYQIPSRSH